MQNIYEFRAPQTNWALIGTNNSFIEFFNNNAMYEIYGTRLQSGTILTTHFGSSNNNILICGDAIHLYARFPVSSGIDTVEKANEFFFNNEVMCYGILEDSIETDLTAEEIVQYKALHSNYPTTIVDNSEQAEMSVVYKSFENV